MKVFCKLLVFILSLFIGFTRDTKHEAGGKEICVRSIRDMLESIVFILRNILLLLVLKSQ